MANEGQVSESFAEKLIERLTAITTATNERLHTLTTTLTDAITRVNTTLGTTATETNLTLKNVETNIGLMRSETTSVKTAQDNVDRKLFYAITVGVLAFAAIVIVGVVIGWRIPSSSDLTSFRPRFNAFSKPDAAKAFAPATNVLDSFTNAPLGLASTYCPVLTRFLNI